jgi:hypothetical protein
MPDCLQSVRLGGINCIMYFEKNEDKIKDKNGKKRSKVQLSLDSFLSRKE